MKYDQSTAAKMTRTTSVQSLEEPEHSIIVSCCCGGRSAEVCLNMPNSQTPGPYGPAMRASWNSIKRIWALGADERLFLTYYSHKKSLKIPEWPSTTQFGDIGHLEPLKHFIFGSK